MEQTKTGQFKTNIPMEINHNNKLITEIVDLTVSQIRSERYRLLIEAIHERFGKDCQLIEILKDVTCMIHETHLIEIYFYKDEYLTEITYEVLMGAQFEK